MKVHFISIGGSAMHNLAIALSRKGYQVTGSDDGIFEPSKSRLVKEGLMPAKIGWDENNICSDLDAIILGMHARIDNPELLKAQDLGLKIYSYPEYIYEQSKEKKRIVIGGSHGKTTITSMILHVINELGMESDYMVGAQLEGYDCMVKLSDAPIIILEGDEYLSSPIDRRPKFHLYKPDIALLSGIAWDHINVFPTFEMYVDQFQIFADSIEDKGSLVYYSGDEELLRIADKVKPGVNMFSYDTLKHKIVDGETIILDAGKEYPIQIFGEHNIQNLNGARLVLNQIGVSDDSFYTAISSFTGASKRLEVVQKGESGTLYKDFAHSPSKLKATLDAVKNQFTDRKLVACMELHTFSSLRADFLDQYNGTMDLADEAMVYFNPEVVKKKKLEPITIEQVKKAFGNENVLVVDSTEDVLSWIRSKEWKNRNLLMMSSGNFDGIDYDQLGKELF
jgi:UDP-N-acetylmuramate: L-alanyl-gamma-D-glutamyl-meso-diaminopimelate ligase